MCYGENRSCHGLVSEDNDITPFATKGLGKMVCFEGEGGHRVQGQEENKRVTRKRARFGEDVIGDLLRHNSFDVS